MEERVLNINIRRDRQNKEESLGVPNAEDFARKYDIELDDEDDEDEEQEQYHVHQNESSHHKDAAESVIIQNIIESQSSHKRIDNLVIKLDEKNKELEKLCTLLEAIEPIPGLDPDKFLQAMEDPSGEGPTDFRDAKILQLAKKCRTLTVALNKERGGGHSKKQEIEDLQLRCEQLQKELNMVSSPAARAVMSKEREKERERERDGRENGGNEESKDMRKELQSAQKQVEDLRRKYHNSQEETKKYQRVLMKELGEGVSIEQAVEEGWRGRAQQIIMLKNKIKRLEASVAPTGAAVSAVRSKSGKQLSEIEQRAMDELADMSNDRQQAIEALTEEHSRVLEESQQLKQKLEAQKARIRILENDSSKQKNQIKVLLEKTTADDELVEALRAEQQECVKIKHNHINQTQEKIQEEQNLIYQE
eukprot:CAMPEP_0182421090 /NCGR_PEP_ID=MMETSP1167-20130531/6309_1 /TAXON_ID=2988 /ORGANISM="Mallomonas Sp, Strain CCMP3275" /LENGTH=419 /DNA_ID=CAMNT_0024597867 /DNA_START=12 /DNA_END=1272 /DNA_ORIENTATION=+